MDQLGKIRGIYSGVSPRLIGRLLAVPLILSLIDLAVTLHFQPVEYWQGNRSVVVEGNPIARLALSIHPLWIIPGFIGWYGLVFPLIFKTPAWFGLRLSIFLVLGHLTMISGWLIRNSPDGILYSCFVVVCALPVSGALLWPIRSQWEGQEPVGNR